jgi:hypothetical protein
MDNQSASSSIVRMKRDVEDLVESESDDQYQEKLLNLLKNYQKETSEVAIIPTNITTLKKAYPNISSNILDSIVHHGIPFEKLAPPISPRYDLCQLIARRSTTTAPMSVYSVDKPKPILTFKGGAFVSRCSMKIETNKKLSAILGEKMDEELIQVNETEEHNEKHCQGSISIAEDEFFSACSEDESETEDYNNKTMENEHLSNSSTVINDDDNMLVKGSVDVTDFIGPSQGGNGGDDANRTQKDVNDKEENNKVIDTIDHEKQHQMEQNSSSKPEIQKSNGILKRPFSFDPSDILRRFKLAKMESLFRKSSFIHQD